MVNKTQKPSECAVIKYLEIAFDLHVLKNEYDSYLEESSENPCSFEQIRDLMGPMDIEIFEKMSLQSREEFLRVKNLELFDSKKASFKKKQSVLKKELAKLANDNPNLVQYIKAKHPNYKLPDM